MEPLSVTALPDRITTDPEFSALACPEPTFISPEDKLGVVLMDTAPLKPVPESEVEPLAMRTDPPVWKPEAPAINDNEPPCLPLPALS